jgi:HSP20 family protein
MTEKGKNQGQGQTGTTTLEPETHQTQATTGSPQAGRSTQEGSTTLSRREASWLPSVGIANPFSLMQGMADEMDRLFDGFLGLGGLGRPRQREVSRGGQALWYPQVEVQEKDGKLVVCADLPGLKKEDVHVEVRDNALILEGERRQESEQKGEGFYRSERSYGRFYRAIPLPEGVDPDQAQANFKDGVLEVTLPVPERHSKGRQIDIR